MKLFKRTGKANKKWRDVARLIDISKTKVIIIASDERRQASAEHLPPWVYKRLLGDLGLSDAVDTLEDPEWLGQKDHLDQVHAKLSQQLGLQTQPVPVLSYLDAWVS